MATNAEIEEASGQVQELQSELQAAAEKIRLLKSQLQVCVFVIPFIV